MLPPLSRVFEICLYSLPNFFPFLIFALYPFRDDLRFSRTKTGLLIEVLHVSSDSVRTSRLFFNREYLCRIVFDQYAFLCIFLLYCHQEIPRPAFIRTAYDF